MTLDSHTDTVLGIEDLFNVSHLSLTKIDFV